MMEINPDMVELACSAKGCALIARDDNPLNDVAPIQVQKLFESLMSKKSSKWTSSELEILEVLRDKRMLWSKYGKLMSLKWVLVFVF